MKYCFSQVFTVLFPELIEAIKEERKKHIAQVESMKIITIIFNV